MLNPTRTQHGSSILDEGMLRSSETAMLETLGNDLFAGIALEEMVPANRSFALSA